MQKTKIGEIIRKIRKERKVTAKQLCSGLCQTSTLSYYENDERIPDAMTFYYLMRRLGINVKNFSVMLNAREVEYFKWRIETQEAIQKKNWDELEQLIQTADEFKQYGNVRIYKQYEYYIKAIIEANKYDKKNKAIELLQKAISQTIPNIYRIEEKEMMIGSGEMLLIIYYIYLCIIEKKIEKSAGIELFRIYERYVLRGLWDQREKAEIYAKLVCVWCRIFKREITKNEQLRICENAIQLLKETKTLYDITEILSLYGEVIKDFETNKYKVVKKQTEIFYEIFSMEEIDLSFRPEIYYGNDANFFVMNELLYIQRKVRKITQEVLSENICETENYSRIETGIRIPSTSRFYMLASKLEIGWGYYRGELDTADMEAYKIRYQQREAIRREDWQEAKRLILELQYLLDMEIEENEQYVKDKLFMAEYRLGERSLEETLEDYIKLFSMTVTEDTASMQNYVYNQIEIEIMTHIAMVLDENGETKNAIEFLESNLFQISQNQMGIMSQWIGVNFLLRELGNLYFKTHEYEKALQCNRYVLQKNLNNREGMNLPKILDGIADDLEHMGVEYIKMSAKRYLQTFYVADFFKMEKIADFIKKYYQSNFCKDKKVLEEFIY